MKKTVHEKLKQARLYAGMTQNNVAEITGIHQETISRIEGGGTEIKTGTIVKICDALGAEVEFVPSDIALHHVFLKSLAEQMQATPIKQREIVKSVDGIAIVFTLIEKTPGKPGYYLDFAETIRRTVELKKG